MGVRPGPGPQLTALADLPVRGRVVCSGMIEAVTILPAALAPEFSAIVVEHEEDTGATQPPRLRLVWLGRRRIPGIFVGTRLRFEGMVSSRGGLPTIYNPRYEIIGTQET